MHQLPAGPPVWTFAGACGDQGSLSGGQPEPGADADHGTVPCGNGFCACERRAGDEDQQKEAAQLVMEVPRTIDDRAYIYAKSKESLDALIDLIEETLKRGDTLCELLIPYSEGGVLNTITSTSTVESTEYLPEGIKVIAHLSAKNAQKYAEYISPS